MLNFILKPLAILCLTYQIIFQLFIIWNNLYFQLMKPFILFPDGVSGFLGCQLLRKWKSPTYNMYPETHKMFNSKHKKKDNWNCSPCSEKSSQTSIFPTLWKKTFVGTIWKYRVNVLHYYCLHCDTRVANSFLRFRNHRFQILIGSSKLAYIRQTDWMPRRGWVTFSEAGGG